MYILTSADTLEVLLAGSVTTNQAVLYAAYVDLADDASAFTADMSSGATNSTTAVTWVGSPAAATKRQVKQLSLFNADTASIVATVRIVDGGTNRTVAKITLAPGERAAFIETSGWSMFSATGPVVSTTALPDGDRGDITVTSQGVVWTIDADAITTTKIANDSVTNAKLANVATNTFKGRLTATTGDPEDLTPAQARKVLNPVSALSISSGVVNIDCSLGTSFTLSLTANVTSITFSNLQGSGFASEIEVQFTQDGTGSRTVAWPAAFKALGGSDTTVSSAANTVTVLSAKTWDNGTTWRYALQESA